MKKIINLLLFVIVVYFFAICAYAQNGDVVGDIYSTDIMAYVNGVEIESYNIGGKTAIVMEDLYDYTAWDFSYGFKWSYDNESRTLSVDSFDVKCFTNKEIQRGNVGEIAGKVYETDIRVIFNSREVPSYNIGGRTVVCIEDLGYIDELSPNKDFNYSKYMCNFQWNNIERIVCLNSYQDKSYRSFTEYPIRKLAFKLDENKLSCTFDQMNAYVPTFEVNFSEEYKNDIYIIKSIYMDNDIIGSIYFDNMRYPHMQLDYKNLYNKIKNLATVFSYDEAKKYVTDNFKVLDKKEDENATVYIAQKENMKYFLYAFKNGGFLANGGYSSDHTLEFKQSESEGVCLYVYPFAGPHGSTGIMQPFSSSSFNFYSGYDNFAYENFSSYNQKSLSVGEADLVIDGKNFEVDTILCYNCNEPMINVDKMSELLGLDYKFINGKFVFNIDVAKHTISINVDNVKNKPDMPIYTLYANDVELNGKTTEFKNLGDEILLTNEKECEKSIIPYLYKSQAYVPFRLFEKLCNSK